MPAPDDIAFEVLDDGMDHPTVTVVVTTPIGELLIMAEMSEENAAQTLRLDGAHVQARARTGAFGVRALRRLPRP